MLQLVYCSHLDDAYQQQLSLQQILQVIRLLKWSFYLVIRLKAKFWEFYLVPIQEYQQDQSSKKCSHRIFDDKPMTLSRARQEFVGICTQGVEFFVSDYIQNKNSAMAVLLLLSVRFPVKKSCLRFDFGILLNLLLCHLFLQNWFVTLNLRHILKLVYWFLIFAVVRCFPVQILHIIVQISQERLQDLQNSWRRIRICSQANS